MIDYMLDLWSKLHVSYKLRIEVLGQLASLTKNNCTLNFEDDSENSSSLSN
jgi:hypothetical protein